jgi:hypothetical protein
MTPVSAYDLLRAWTHGRGLHPVDQALTLLALAEPGASAAELAALSLGQRDARLLDLREAVFGPRLGGLANCPRCQNRLEFDFAAADAREQPVAECAPEIEWDGRLLRIRPLTSFDLAAIADCDDAETARALLAARCLLDPEGAELPEEALPILAEGLARCDPQAEVLLDLVCSGCGYAWQLVFDIASFLWTEVAAEARRLVHAVDALARAYGWREADILVMDPGRRQLYLEMAGA